MTDQLLLSSGKVAAAAPAPADGDVAALSLSTLARLRVETDLTVTSPTPGSAFLRVTTASTNAVVVKASAGTLMEVTVFNPTAAIFYAKFYNVPSGLVVGTTVPILVIPVAVNANVSLAFGPLGKRFSSGISFAAVTGPLSTDAVVTAAGGIISATYL